MPVFVVLLRAVNVGGTAKLPMGDLKGLCEKAGFQNVRTYIASGNDRYTTEVVLQRFRGELQLLESRGGGADRDSFPEEGAPRGSGFKRAAAADPIDDDIPF